MKKLTILTLALMGFLAACNDGPAERLGEEIDQAATDARNAVEDVCEDATGDNC